MSGGSDGLSEGLWLFTQLKSVEGAAVLSSCVPCQGAFLLSLLLLFVRCVTTLYKIWVHTVLPILLNSWIVFDAIWWHHFFVFNFILDRYLSLSLGFSYLCRAIVIFWLCLGGGCNHLSLSGWVAGAHFHRCKCLCWIFELSWSVLDCRARADERFAVWWQAILVKRIGTVKTCLSITLPRSSHIFDLIDHLFADQVWTRRSLFDHVAVDFGFGLRHAYFTWSLLCKLLRGKACGRRRWDSLDSRRCRGSDLALRCQLGGDNDLLLVAIVAKDGAFGLAVGHRSLWVVLLFYWLRRFIDGVRALLKCLIWSLRTSLLLLSYLILSLSKALSCFSVRVTSHYRSIWR